MLRQHSLSLGGSGVSTTAHKVCRADGLPSLSDHACFLLVAGKSRGYAFIEFEHKNDMKLAYKNADGKKVEGKRVVVDVERGRTVPSW